MSEPYPPSLPPQPLRAPEGTSPSTMHFWLIVAIFGVQNVPAYVYLLTFDWSMFMAFSMDPSDPLAVYSQLFSPSYLAVLVVTLLAYAGTAFLAYLDSRELQARGVSSPFHWVTSLVPSYGSWIYIIGRSVVVHRRTGGGLAPLWAFVAINVASAVLYGIVTLMMINTMLSLMPALTNQ